jgi:hypothetical protein
MDSVRDQIDEAYQRNRGEIDDRINKLVSSICATQPVNPENLTITIHNIIDSFFYKRPSSKVIQFLDSICCYPPEVLYEAFMSYSVWLVGAGQKKKHSTSYFLGFVRKCFFNFKETKRQVVKTDVAKGLPDDL